MEIILESKIELNPILYSKFILLFNNTFNSNNDLGFLQEYTELIYELFQDFMFQYQEIYETYEETSIEHFLLTEHCIEFVKNNFRFELEEI